ncbi:hypothetical protein [Ancylobacter lacus]|uniref:hypothetical protein n=1 Tax=Ancylobacter lacus TaxID=2579970 RepID=UPI001BCBB12B|nr:hypothetical protein [Ancylobacter lacus]MBS7537612.1 hypothetical protein [Ancylobacter lacus]
MGARRLVLILLAWLLPVLPASAGVAEREPPSSVLWLGLLLVIAWSWVMAYRRWWLPLALWLPVALLVAGLIAPLADPAVADAVRAELGAGYVFQLDLCCAVAVVVPLMFADLRYRGWS